ncbi:MAG: hypothetical protein ACTSSE_16535 [Candidatus Thorarchaeota archaeon]
MTEVKLTCKLVDGTTIKKSFGTDSTKVSVARNNLKEVDLRQLGPECGVERLRYRIIHSGL